MDQAGEQMSNRHGPGKKTDEPKADEQVDQEKGDDPGIWTDGPGEKTDGPAGEQMGQERKEMIRRVKQMASTERRWSRVSWQVSKWISQESRRIRRENTDGIATWTDGPGPGRWIRRELDVQEGEQMTKGESRSRWTDGSSKKGAGPSEETRMKESGEQMGQSRKQIVLTGEQMEQKRK
jgi:hypothetical protein